MGRAVSVQVPSVAVCAFWVRCPWPALSLALVLLSVVEATASARAVERGDGTGAAGLAGAGAADGRLEEDVAGACRVASRSCRTFNCRYRSASCVACAGVEARSVIEVLIRSSSALRRMDRSCSLSAHARSDCRSRRRGVLEALSSSESAALPDSRFDLYIWIWKRS